MGGTAGRAAIDPRILFALWTYATLDGMGSNREVGRLSLAHDAYRWICGGVAVNYHALNDFRSGNDKLMDDLLTDNVAALATVGALRLVRVARDGMHVRASAGAASLRRCVVASLRRCVVASLRQPQGELGTRTREMVQTIEQLYLKLTSAPGGTLVSASTPAARIAQIHEMSMKGAVMIMREAAPVALPAGRTVSLAPNGAHIMLIELAHPLAAGELITVTLILIVDDAQKKRERLEVAARVEALPPATSRPGTRRRS